MPTEEERLRAISRSARQAVAGRATRIPPRCDECGRLARWWYDVLGRYLCDPCSGGDGPADGYPADNPLSRLEALQRDLDEARTQPERDGILKRIGTLRNGVA